MDNCATHKSDALREVVEASGMSRFSIYFIICMISLCLRYFEVDAWCFYPLTPRITVRLNRALAVVRICFFFHVTNHFFLIITTNSLVKAHLRRHYHRFVNSEYPEQDLVNACFEAVSPEKAKGWFRDCGYLPM